MIENFELTYEFSTLQSFWIYNNKISTLFYFFIKCLLSLKICSNVYNFFPICACSSDYCECFKLNSDVSSFDRLNFWALKQFGSWSVSCICFNFSSNWCQHFELTSELFTLERLNTVYVLQRKLLQSPIWCCIE